MVYLLYTDEVVFFNECIEIPPGVLSWGIKHVSHLVSEQLSHSSGGILTVLYLLSFTLFHVGKAALTRYDLI